MKHGMAKRITHPAMFTDPTEKCPSRQGVVFCLLVIGRIDGWMLGRLEGGKPAGWLDQITHTSTGNWANHWPSILPIDRSANKPTFRPTCYKSNHWHSSIYPTDQPEAVLTSDHCLNFQHRDLKYHYFCLLGCMVVPTSISKKEKRTPSSLSDRHFSIWPSSELLFESPNFWLVLPYHWALFTYSSRGIHLSSFWRTSPDEIWERPWGISFVMSFSLYRYILMVYKARSAPRLVMDWDQELVAPLWFSQQPPYRSSGWMTDSEAQITNFFILAWFWTLPCPVDVVKSSQIERG